MNIDDRFPRLTPAAAEMIRALGEGERDLFTGGPADRDGYLMSLRHFKAYQFAFPLACGRSVLELGCGTGAGAVYLSRVATRVVGLDVEARLVVALPVVWPRAEVEWKVYDGGVLPFPDRTFDLVTSFQVIEHVRNHFVFLAEAARVLRPGGVLVITTPNRTLRVAPGQRPWNPYHTREFWPWELRGLLRRAGLREVRLWGLHGDPEIAHAEQRRTVKMMLGGCWMALPGGMRDMLKRLAGAGGVADVRYVTPPCRGEEARAIEPPGPNVYGWKRWGRLWSLDLLAMGMR